MGCEVMVKYSCVVGVVVVFLGVCLIVWFEVEGVLIGDG